MSYNLYLDDVRQPYQSGDYMYPVDIRKIYRLEDWIIVRSYKEFIAKIENDGLPLKVSFDHDLADVHYDPDTYRESFEYHEETGYDCAKWMCNYCLENGLPVPEYYCHSQNPTGKDNILGILKNYENYLK